MRRMIGEYRTVRRLRHDESEEVLSDRQDLIWYQVRGLRRVGRRGLPLIGRFRLRWAGDDRG